MSLQTILVYYFFLALGTILPVLIAVAFFTLAERKIMAFVQRRRGPDVVGF
jgi:NADH-ubiquinone oxidoreductase chain 1